MLPLLLSLPILALALPAPPKPAGISIPLTKSFSLSHPDGSVNLAALRAHAAYLDAKYALPPSDRERRRQGGGEGGVGLMDFKDQLWYGPVEIGSEGQQFMVDFDTGSSDLFVAGANCANCGTHTKYDPSASSTSSATGQNFTLRYGDGSTAVGSIYTDTVTLANLTATSQALGAAAYETGTFSTDVSSGILGLGFPLLSAFNQTPFFTSLMQQNAVSAGAFAFNLASEGSSLYLGGGDDAPFLGGDVAWSAVTLEKYWEVALESVQINGSAVVRNVSAIMDTGTTLIIGDAPTVAAFYASIPNAEEAASTLGPGFYIFPCSSAPQSIALTFSGVSWPLSPDAFNLGPVTNGSELCVGGVYAQGSYGFWIVGDLFLRGVATVFDVDNKRVGFAELAGSS